MPLENVSFQTSDNVTLRGWFFKPADPGQSELPCLVMAHGLAALKEFDLDRFAQYFVSSLDIACLVYDNRGFGESDTKDGQPRLEVIASQQQSDFQDAITYAQLRPDVNANKIGIWGSSYSGGHVLCVGAIDRRVKAVLSQVPGVDGWANGLRLVRGDLLPVIHDAFQQDRLDRAAGKPPQMIPVVNDDPLGKAVLPSADSYKFYKSWEEKTDWKNEITLRSVEMIRQNIPVAFINHISPTPLLMTVALNDVVTPTDLALEAYSRALEPKQLQILPGGHFDAYSGPNFERNVKTQAQFLKDHLCTE